MPLPSDIATPRPITGPFQILTVCTGNVCRSPQAAGLLRAAFRELLGPRSDSLIRVESAGTHGLEGLPMDPSAAAEAVRMGVSDGDVHVARQLTASMVEQADLVLGMERAHRGAAVRLDPSANRRAFTLTELATVVEEVGQRRDLEPPDPDLAPQELLAAVIAAAADARGPVAASEQFSYDIEDPYRREPKVYRRSADAIRAAVGAIVTSIALIAQR